jgi:hypothetical protein
MGPFLLFEAPLLLRQVVSHKNTNDKAEYSMGASQAEASFALHTYLNRVWISAVVRNPLPLRSRHLNKYVKPSGVSLFSRAKTKSRKLSKSISRLFPPPTLLRRTCSSKTEKQSHIVVMYSRINS